jgi:hypothetical protein
VPALSGLSVLVLGGYLLLTKRSFFRVFWRPSQTAVLSWRKDLLPMQWRLGLQGLFTYLAFPLYTTLVFNSLGAEQAGRMGMTLQVVTAVLAIAMVMVNTRAPQLAILAAQASRAELNRLWRHASRQAAVVYLVLIATVVAALLAASFLGLPIAQRVLATQSVLLLSAGCLAALGVQCMATYLRAHKEELLTSVGAVTGLLYGLSGWLGLAWAGPLGIATSYFAVTACVTLPLTVWVFVRSRSRWAPC